MAAGNRKNPQRAKSSESRYSLVEFMRDFPEDDACLEWLWSTRYLNDEGLAYCTKCQTNRKFTKYEERTPHGDAPTNPVRRRRLQRRRGLPHPPADDDAPKSPLLA